MNSEKKFKYSLNPQFYAFWKPTESTEKQYFKIKDIPVTEMKYFKINILKNFGDRDTYLNQVELGYSKESK